MNLAWWWDLQDRINRDFNFDIKREKVAERLLRRFSKKIPSNNLDIAGKNVVVVGADITPDGYPSDINWATRNGSSLVIHGHGDNLSRLIEHVPRMNFTTLTSTYPSKSLECWGGFTDGDRSILMALSLGAKSVSLLGFSFDSIGKYTGISVPQIKKKKLFWAKHIISEISKRYNRFHL